MSPTRSFLVPFLFATFAATTSAQTVALSEPARVGDTTAVTLQMKLDGDLIIIQDGQPSKLKLVAEARHQFRERILAVEDRTGLASKAARWYATAESRVTVNGQSSERRLRPERRLCVSQRTPDGFTAYSPGGPLRRDELDVIGGHFDTLSLSGLLPGREVALNDTWTLSNATALGLGLFEGLIGHDLTGKLTELRDGVATFTITGTAKGIELGATVTLTIAATGRFDLTQQRLIGLVWKQDDRREQGPASPAIQATTEVTVTREGIAEPTELSPVALESVPPGHEVPAHLSAVEIADPRGRFTLLAPRGWQLVGQTDRHTVLRWMDRGDFVAQATITPWQKAAPGQHLTAKEFKEAMMNAPGWQPEEIIQELELPGLNGGWGYRLTATGAMDGVKIVQTFFLVAGPDGDQAVVTFTMRQAQVTKLGANDLTLVEGLSFTK